MTFDMGRPVLHELERGDAVLFHSEKVHNVTAVMDGLRQSLVIELWDGSNNVADRHM